MSEPEQTIASLRSSIDSLRAMTVGLQAQAAGKADASAVAALSTRITSCEGRVAALGSSVAAQGPAVTKPTSRVTSEHEARAHADTALAKRIGSVQCFASAPAELHVEPDEAVEPLRMGKVVFHGETARAIRDAQAVLKSANVGQLEVVKRANEAGEPFVEIDGQVFINEAEINSTTFEVKLVRGANGQYHAADIGLGVEQAAGSAAKAPVDAGQLLSEIAKQITESEVGAGLARQASAQVKQAQEQIRQVIRDEIRPGGILHRY